MKKKPAVKLTQQRLTDEELQALIAKQRAKQPDISRAAVLAAIRALGKSCSGGRVRALWVKAAPKAKAKRAAA